MQGLVADRGDAVFQDGEAHAQAVAPVGAVGVPLATRGKHAHAGGEEFGHLEGLACFEHVLHVFLPLHEVGVLLRHGLHLRLHGEVFVQQGGVQLVERVDGADVAFHDAPKRLGFFLGAGDFPVAVLHLGEQAVDAFLLRGEFRQHHGILGLKRVVREAHFLQVEHQLVLGEAQFRVVAVESADDVVLVCDLVAQKGNHKDQGSDDNEPGFLGHLRHGANG